MPIGSSANRGGFAPDLAGDYIAQLVVTNEFGVSSEPCEATLEAIPGQGLWVQMSWIHSGDDMDLHLLYNNGSYNSSNDCYYANCPGGGPDWGQVGNTSDNPSLDQDDVSGIGPENTTIQTPYVFHRRSSRYPGSTFQSGNDVTMASSWVVCKFGQTHEPSQEKIPTRICRDLLSIHDGDTTVKSTILDAST